MGREHSGNIPPHMIKRRDVALTARRNGPDNYLIEQPVTKKPQMINGVIVVQGLANASSKSILSIIIGGHRAQRGEL